MVRKVKTLAHISPPRLPSFNDGFIEPYEMDGWMDGWMDRGKA
jgi:hypothetical protein